MSTLFTAKEIQTIFHMSYLPQWEDVTGISIDTRTLKKGDLFIARKGNTEDGAFFIKEALEKGAVGVLTETLCDDSSAAKQLKVPSCDGALDALATFARNRLDHMHADSTIIAITGSAGKTTVKEWLLYTLSPFLNTIASKASYNNHIGVPYSVAHLTTTTQVGIFELGMNNPGEIAPLSLIARPDLAIITSIGESHIGHLGTLEGIAEEKSEIFRGLNATGTSIFPIDTPYKEYLLRKADSLCLQHMWTFGENHGATACLLSFTPDVNEKIGGIVHARLYSEEITYAIALHGDHNAHNSLVVLLVCKYIAERYHLPLDPFIQRLSMFTAVEGRGARHVLPYKKGNILLIDDAYNANPASMRAGLSTLVSLSCQGGGRKIAVLGDMKELGDDSSSYHRALSLVLQDVGVDLVFATGENMLELWKILPEDKKGAYAPTVSELLFEVLDHVRGHDIVFVKGSKSSHISKVVDAFLAQQK